MLYRVIFLCLVLFLPAAAQQRMQDFYGHGGMENFIEKEIISRTSSYTLNNTAYPGGVSFDVTYYKLDMNVTYSPAYLKAKVTIEGKSITGNFNSFFLDFTNDFNVDSVISGTESLQFNHTGDRLEIFLNDTLRANAKFSVDVYYRGTPVAKGLGSFVFDSHNGQPLIWTLSEPYGAKEWWPCKDTPGDKADSSDVWITCDSSLTGASNGILEDVITNAGGTKTYKWKSRYPISHYLISLAISNYTYYKDSFRYSETDSMPIEHYIYPEVFDSVKSQLDKTVPMLELFSSLYGEYPFINEKYGHAQFGRGGMEHQTITSLGNFSDGVIAHELAHQWFGDKITCKDWRHIWLNEGFATYSEGLYLEKTEGSYAYSEFMNYHIERAKQAVGSIYVQNLSEIYEILNGLRSYSKGAVVLHMLRGITGDSLFFRILKNYANDPLVSYNAAVTEDFQRSAENTTGTSLEYFFNQWIYGENFPKYYVDWNYASAGNSLYEINVNISQSDNTYPKYFTMPLQLKIKTSSADTTVTVFNDKQVQEFKFYIKGEPLEFLFDPSNLVIKDVLIKDPPGFLVPADFYLDQNYPNPFNGSTTLSFGLPERSFVKINVYDILGNLVITVLDIEMNAGHFNIHFNFSSIGIASGVYIVRLEAGKNYISKKLVLLK
jgi:aminopeptidase N